MTGSIGIAGFIKKNKNFKPYYEKTRTLAKEKAKVYVSICLLLKYA